MKTGIDKLKMVQLLNPDIRCHIMGIKEAGRKWGRMCLIHRLQGKTNKQNIFFKKINNNKAVMREKKIRE